MLIRQILSILILMASILGAFLPLGAAEAWGHKPVSSQAEKSSADKVPSTIDGQSKQVHKRDPNHQYCPEASTLSEKDHFWNAPGGWKSFSPSFAKSVRTFTGVQWIGIRVGKIICLYSGEGQEQGDVFPIAIERDNLVQEPVGFNWRKNKGSYKPCVSQWVTDCPFKPVNKKQDVKKDVEDIYEGLGKFK